jgi:alpha-ketoglutarate-dependent taurine dioxygenase
MLPYPIVAEDNEVGELAACLRRRWTELGPLLDDHGALLLRRFRVDRLTQFRDAVIAATSDLVDYVEPSTPRRQIGDRVYTSTDYPNDRTIPLHHEMAYRRSWPRYLWFWCERPADQGGGTTLGDSRRIAQALPDDLRRRFAEAGVTYQRTFNTGFDLTWQRVFSTESRAAVEQILTERAVAFEWLDGDVLRTRQTVEGLVRHPCTDREAWFNQAALFHPSALDPHVHASLVAAVGTDRLPRNAFFGDGRPINDSDLATIRAVLEHETVPLSWEAGDVLVVDNLAVAHGREPYIGDRRVRVAMAGCMRSSFQRAAP